MHRVFIISFIIAFFLSQVFGLNCYRSYSRPGLDELIGQKLIIGFNGLDVTSDSQVAHDIKNYHLGGVILFDSNPAGGLRNIKDGEQVKKLTTALQNYAKVPLFIGIDLEGGWVNRLKPKYGFPETLSAKHFGEADDPEYTQREAAKIGKTLQELGINLNFAPVVDLEVNENNPIIAFYERSYSRDPDIVVKHSSAFITGLRDYNVASCLKHYPGHGSSNNDSHLGITDVTGTWTDLELIPFRELIHMKKCDMIMTGHLVNRRLDKKYPATMSKNMVKSLLREKIGYNGVVISDDMQMMSIARYYGLKDSILKAINADVDMFIFGNVIDYDESITGSIVEIIKELLHEQKISYYQLLRSHSRIMALKKKIYENSK